MKANLGKGNNTGEEGLTGSGVFGGIERESKNSFFACVDDRSAATLIPIILRWVKPGIRLLFQIVGKRMVHWGNMILLI